MQLQGATVVVTDPAAVPNARRKWPDLVFADTAEEALEGAELVLVLTEWPEFVGLDPEKAKDARRRRARPRRPQLPGRGRVAGRGLEVPRPGPARPTVSRCPGPCKDRTASCPVSRPGSCGSTAAMLEVVRSRGVSEIEPMLSARELPDRRSAKPLSSLTTPRHGAEPAIQAASGGLCWAGHVAPGSDSRRLDNDQPSFRSSTRRRLTPAGSSLSYRRDDSRVRAVRPVRRTSAIGSPAARPQSGGAASAAKVAIASHPGRSLRRDCSSGT